MGIGTSTGTSTRRLKLTIKLPESGDRRVPELQEVEDRIGIQFSDRSLLQQAFVHRSYVNEVVDGPLPGDNERLEFLGDSVLGFITSDYLYRRYPDLNEGELTRLRSSLVRRSTLARLARRLNLGAHLWLGRGEEESGGRERDATLCAVTESVIGAIFLDQGMEVTASFVLDQLQPDIEKLDGYTGSKDPKSRLQEYMQSRFGRAPRYATLDSSGPDHAKHFIQKVSIGRKTVGVGRGYRKQDAEQDAAAMALDYLGEFAPEYEPDEEFEAQFTLAPLDTLPSLNGTGSSKESD
jgi:ribonuclease-3